MADSDYKLAKMSDLTKSNVGLGNVGNFKAVSTEASQSLTDTEKNNARTNIGAYSKPSGGIPASDLADNAKEHEYVDLGLPSGTLWATMNVGATSVTDYGNYYMYGMGAKTYDSSDTPYQGTENPLPEQYDTAAQVWGEGWHMSTAAQIQELQNNTSYQWVTNYQGSGINGGLVTGPNGNTIFLPAAGLYNGGSLSNVGSFGFYWSATPASANYGRYLDVGSGYWRWSSTLRASGFSVRPVHDPFPVSSAKVKGALGINSSTGSATKYLNEQGSFSTITLPTTMVASGSNHAGGLVPDPGSTQGTTKFLREDGTWEVPAGGSVPSNVALLEDASQTASTPSFDPDADTVHTKAQVLTAAQKNQARVNIGITTSTSEPTAADGNDGDIWIVYEV